METKTVFYLTSPFILDRECDCNKFLNWEDLLNNIWYVADEWQLTVLDNNGDVVLTLWQEWHSDYNIADFTTWSATTKNDSALEFDYPYSINPSHENRTDYDELCLKHQNAILAMLIQLSNGNVDRISFTL